MARRLSGTDKAAAATPEKGGEPSSVLNEKSSGQELARVLPLHHPPAGVRGKGGGWNSHNEPGTSTPRGDNKMTSAAAVREGEEGNKGSSDRTLSMRASCVVSRKETATTLDGLERAISSMLQDHRSHSTCVGPSVVDSGSPGAVSELNKRMYCHCQARGHGTTNPHLDDKRLQQQLQHQHALVPKLPLLERSRRVSSYGGAPWGLNGNIVMEAPFNASKSWLDAEAEAMSWKGKAEAAQSTYRQMMSQLQRSDQTRMRQAVEISSLREEKYALEKTNDTLEKEKLKAQEMLNRTRADVSRLRALLSLYHFPRHLPPPHPKRGTLRQHSHQRQSP